MKEGQRFGPFVIEKSLGSGAMGTVSRARHLKTGRIFALKVIAPGLSDNAGHLARFKREAAILEQLKHPNIVRFYGAGKFEDTPYYAMEYVEGESLDHAMRRRDRLTWEEVVTLGQQLCSALQHAHEHGIIHRDLKPSNLMVLPDGTIKLTDFGIAKDMDLTALTSAHCTVGTASYMSPEQCRGERDLTPKSDLYSLGVLFYELLTGRKPFLAETPMDMFLQHINGTFERPSRLVLDTPVWLDTIICQLLEKKPEQRPRDAEMVSQALGQVAEKVQALQSAGVDAVRGRAIDRPRGAAAADETDKEAARTLRQAVTGKKQRKKRKPLYRRAWAQAAGLVAVLLTGAVLVYWVLQPPSPDVLYDRAEHLMRSKNEEDRQKAIDRDGPLTLYFRHYPGRTDEKAQRMNRWYDELKVAEREQTLQTFLRSRKGLTVIKAEIHPGVETLAADAAVAEDAGDLAQAQKLWQELVQKYAKDERAWGLLAENRLQVLGRAQALAGRIDAAQKAGQDFKPEDETEQLVLPTLQRTHGANPATARDCWQDLKTKYQDDRDHRVLALLAAGELFKLKNGDPTTPEKPVPEKSSKERS